MDEVLINNIVLGICFALIAWVFRSTWSEINNNRDKIDGLYASFQRLEILVTGSYMTRAEFIDLHRDLTNRLDKIADKLDQRIEKIDRYINTNGRQ